MTKEITLSNGKVVKTNPNLNALTLFKLEKEGIIDKGFLSTLLSAGGMQNIDILDTFRIVYAAYREANPNEYMEFEAFMAVYNVDMSESFEYFGAVMKKEAKNKMAQGFQDKAKKKA
ncbi:hypothetical protein IIU_01550 [Bacillus cereus VD133]|uniref:Phage protein n=1 Tax=Bacillus cereus VD133 TaxID=1053233 RepID=A0A9W5PV09_BACCE|nr:hypothetical protein [Bacillus cereus]EOO36947.1 hypothetical protein IIU_01550 [Bacillus cereus VD133]